MITSDLITGLILGFFTGDLLPAGEPATGRSAYRGDSPVEMTATKVDRPS